MVIGLIGLGFTAADVEAKRLGGGMSQGVKRPPPAQRQAPPPRPRRPPSGRGSARSPASPPGWASPR
jgi:hypothetical protein